MISKKRTVLTNLDSNNSLEQTEFILPKINKNEIKNNGSEVHFFNTSKKELPKKYFLYIPENLDVDVLVSDNNPDILGFKKDKLIYIISLIYSIPVRLKDYDFEAENGYVPINSEILKTRVREYNEYLKYLIDVGVLEKRNDFKYQTGVTSSGYRFTNQYNTAPKRAFITWKRLIKAICKLNKKEEEVYIDVSERPLEYLDKWWNSKIEFDYIGAKRWLDNKLLEELKLSKPHCERRYFVRRLVIEKFKNRDYTLHQDSTTGRVHSLLTQLKSELRQFVTYDGKPLVALDIINSQPFLTASLLNLETFISNNIQEKINKYNDREDIKSTIMLALKHEDLKKKDDLIKFLDFVAKGEFYEMFGELLLEKGLVKEKDKKKLRKLTKRVMFASMFGNNNGKCKMKDKKTGKIRFIPNEGMELFKETFPTVHEIFRIIKIKRHNTLACLLQNLEAELVLHRACKIISDERPDVPIFTLHDSIITTDINANYVKRVLSEVLLDAIGIAPKIDEQYWNKEVA